MLEQLQTEVRELRGVVEVQANEIRQLQEDGKSRYQDLDSRLLELTKKVSATPAPVSSSDGALPLNHGADELGVVSEEKVDGGSPSGAKPAAKAAPEPTEEQKLEYQQAYGLIKEKAFDEAIDRLHKFIEHYPEGELAGNAYYWLGEVYMALPKLEQARQAFTVVVGSFPDHRKVADALFKLGVVYDRLQDPRQSEKYLTEVQTKFPESTAAKLAKSYRINK